MATVLEGYNTEKQCFVMRFLCAKELNAKDIHKEIFPIYGGKCLSLKVFYNCVEKFSQERSKVADGRSGAEMAETTVKSLPCCGLRRTGKLYQ
jgi:hypothetical protein